MKNYVYIACSIDGFIATKDGGLDWLESIPNPEKSDYGFSDFINKIDAIIMGRKTFEKVLSFNMWPYTKKVFVLSNTLKSVPDNLLDKVEIVGGDIKEIVVSLNNNGYKYLYIDGGKTIQSFLKEDLIDEMVITTASVLLGDGIPLFSNINNSVSFKIKETVKLNDYLVKNHYVRDK